jgi:hypothetical protein
MKPSGTLSLDVNATFYSEERSKQPCWIAGEVGERHIRQDMLVRGRYRSTLPPPVDDPLIPFLLRTMPSIPTSPSSAVKKATTNDPAGAVKTEASGQAPEAFKLKNELLKTMVDPKNPWHRVTKARDNAETR